MGNQFVVNFRWSDGSPYMHLAQATLRMPNSAARFYQSQDPGTTIDCTAGAISQTTDQGQAVFHARLGGFDNASELEVRVDGVLIKQIPVRSTDLDGDGATGLADLNVFRERYLKDPRAPETDFNADGVTSLADLDLLRAEFFSGARGTVCP